ncbi:MAG TPA: sulfotransferase [Streptosporangiaceae bacterium]
MDRSLAGSARILFITGFNRSGTTLVTSAVTEATGAATLTTGHLARQMPALDRFLTSARKQATAPDRGVDQLPVSESTPEEYGWLLQATTGESAFTARAEQAGVLHALIEELAGESETKIVVLKNPSDTCQEQLLLDTFPGSRVLIVRRELAAIEASVDRAFARMVTSNRYLRALITDRRQAAETLGAIIDPKARQRLVLDSVRKTRRDARRLARQAQALPADRVAFLSYDELRADPRAGAAWAAHLLDPDALAQAITDLTFPEYNRPRSASWKGRIVDWYWARAWRRARARQVRAGILPRTPPAGPRS